MNVAIFASAFHPHVGGVEELCRQIALEYHRRGKGIAIFTDRWPRGLPKIESVDDIPVFRPAMRTAAGSFKSRATYLLTAGANFRWMVRHLRELRPDVLHVQCVSSNAAYAVRASRKLGLPLVVSLQGELSMDASQVFQRSANARRILRDALDRANVVTGCSRQTLAEAEAWYGRPFGDRGRVIYNGISTDEAAVAEPFGHLRPYILAIGRHVPQKGFDLLLAAFALLAADPTFGIDLILAGDGTEHAALRSQAVQLGIGERVVFPGRVDHATALRLFAGCELFVLPSRHEPFGIVNLEAMAAGKAVVATRVGGVPEVVVDGKTGLLVPPEDPTAFSEALHRVISDRNVREMLAAGGLRRAAQFDWRAIADEYLDSYAAAMSAGLTATV